MIRPSHTGQTDLTTFSIVIAKAKSDPDIREAILADGSFRPIWPLIAGADDELQGSIHNRAANLSIAHTIEGQRMESPASPATDDIEMTGAHGSWKSFFASPQFYVVTSTLVVILAGASMYLKLDGKIDSVRMEVKADSQALEQRISSRFDKIDSRFEKIDSRFESLLNKIDSDNKEMRTLVREGQKQPAS